MNSEKEQKKKAEGHRKRCKTRLLSQGASTLSDAELLEMLLFYAVPRRDVRPQAEALIERFGSLDAVLNAEIEEITKCTGLKAGAEVLFALLRETLSRTTVAEGDESLLDGDGVKNYLLELYRGKEVETVYALYFDEGGIFLGRQVILRGDINSARFSLRKITEGVIRVGGKSVILAHNHPSDILVPSSDDIISTKRIAAHLSANEITLIDHYIVGKNDVASILKIK